MMIPTSVQAAIMPVDFGTGSAVIAVTVVIVVTANTETKLCRAGYRRCSDRYRRYSSQYTSKLFHVAILH
jgi:hypothetical protein